MKNLREMMSDYFEDTHVPKKQSLLSEHTMPVSPVACNWVVHTSPERFYREFVFQNQSQVLAFVTEVLRYQKEVNHSGTQKIEDNKVSIEVYTHDVNRITELDQEYRQHVDFIYRDVLDFGF